MKISCDVEFFLKNNMLLTEAEGSLNVSRKQTLD